MCMCVCKGLQFFLFFFCSLERKSVGTKLATRGGEGRSASAAPGLFHFICSVMSLVTAVRGREI